MPRTPSQRTCQPRPSRAIANRDSRGRLRTDDIRLTDAITGFAIPGRDAVRNGEGRIVSGINFDSYDWPSPYGSSDDEE